MTIVYVGPHDAVEVVDDQGRGYTCERDKPIELPESLAAGLLEQDTWTSDEKQACLAAEAEAAAAESKAAKQETTDDADPAAAKPRTRTTKKES